MDDQVNITGRFELAKSDGIHCSQVISYNDDNVQYWKEQAQKNGYLIAFDFHASQGALFDNEMAYDVYQIFPPEQAEGFKHLKQI